jgi:outer membrane lipoprotein-sorting protein
MRVRIIQLVSFSILTVFWVPVFSRAQMTGLEIIEKVYFRPTGNDRESEMTMTLVNSRGNRRVRTIKQFAKDYGTEEKTVMFFLSPADVRNTSFMNWSYDQEEKEDDQWIYLPALQRIKRISGDSRGDYFMGSDFTYDDLGDRHPMDDRHLLLREETIGSEAVFVVKSVPRDEEYMYSKTISWVIKDKWIGQKKEFYDEDGELLKILSVEQSEKIGGYWVLTNIKMHNVQKDHTTVIELKNVQVDRGVPDSMFTERMMKRGVR